MLSVLVWRTEIFYNLSTSGWKELVGSMQFSIKKEVKSHHDLEAGILRKITERTSDSWIFKAVKKWDYNPMAYYPSDIVYL